MTTYYVDAISGSDANNGLTEDAAWQTITKVNASAFVAGDFIRFRRGRTWRGVTLNIDQGGNALSNITYGAYDKGSIYIQAIQDYICHSASYSIYTNQI